MRISVIIPTFNRAGFVTRAIDSVLNQTVAPHEIIVVDDGSTDNTCETLKARYSDSVSLHKRPENRGVSAARNFGIANCNGDWIALLDSDDEWLPDKLKHQIEQLRNSPHAICHTNEIWIRNGVRVNQMNKHQKYGGDIFHHCLPMCVMSPSTMLLQKDIILQAGGFDESLPACEDYDLWLRLCAQFPVLYLDQQLIKKYGGHADQLSRKHWGMDRFRVQSMDTLLQSGTLSNDQEVITQQMLKKKLCILQGGATKHNNQPLLEYCDNLSKKYGIE